MVATGEARPSEATAGVPEPTVDEPQAIGAHGPVTDDPAQPPPGAADRPAEKTGGGGPIRRYRWLALGLGLVVAAAAAAIIVFTGGGSTPGQGQLFQAVLRPVPDTTSRVVALRPSGCTATR